MKGLVLVIGLMLSTSSSFAIPAKQSKVSALEVLNAIVAPVQAEIASGTVTDVSNAVELQKYMDFISSGNTIDRVEKVIEKNTTHYSLRIRDCHDSGRSCSRSGVLYIVSVSVVDGKKAVSSLIQRF
ncbi:MAG: hypothetical protein JNJ49_07645 [Bdellovibrionaceae bacterium]|nr:hypothetical protein [Pseudobdellovibrionaceae bacterium]